MQRVIPNIKIIITPPQNNNIENNKDIPGKSQRGEEQNHEEKEEVEFTHHAQLLTGPKNKRALNVIIFLHSMGAWIYVGILWVLL